MNRRTLIIIIVVALFIVIALLANYVGGVAIRTVQQRGSQVTVESWPPEPVSVCNQLRLAFRAPAGIANSHFRVVARDSQRDTTVGEASLGDGVVTILIPESVLSPVSLVFISSQTNEILTSSAKLRLAPPQGLDCLGR